MDRKLAAIALIVFFSLIGLLASILMSLDTELSTPEGPGGRKNAFMEFATFEASKEQAIYFVPVIFFTALGTASVVYYVASKRTGDGLGKQDARKATLSAFVPEEKEVMDMLLKHNGSVHQYELTRVSGMTKVQTHRLIERMIAKGVISKKKLGKVNRIELSDELRVLL